MLGIDTSFSYLALGLADEEGIVGEITSRQSQNIARSLSPALSWFLNAHGKTIRDIEGFAVGIGPGSFTGLRIGIAFAKTLAYFTNKPIKGISTLFLIASSLPEDKLRAVVMPAYGGEVYVGVYKGRESILEDSILPFSAFLSYLKELKEECYLCVHPSLSLPSMPSFVIVEALPPRGGLLAKLGRESILKGDVDDPLLLLPNYLRPSQAEMRLYGKGS